MVKNLNIIFQSRMLCLGVLICILTTAVSQTLYFRDDKLILFLKANLFMKIFFPFYAIFNNLRRVVQKNKLKVEFPNFLGNMKTEFS